jgi:hypothetical protein
MRPSSLLAGLGCLLFVLPLAAIWQTHGVPPSVQLLAGVLLVATIARPQWGLLILAFVLPMAPQIHARTEAIVGRTAVAEILLVPVLFGAVVRIAAGARWPASRLAAPALVLGSLVAVDGVLGLGERQLLTTWPLDFVRGLWRHLSTGYYGDQSGYAAFHEMALWIEGLTLAVMAERLLRHDRRGWPAMLLAGASAVAFTSWIRLFEISMRQPEPLTAALDFLANVRQQTLFRDENAAASLYALFFVPAAWLAFRGGDAGRWRAHAGYGLAAIIIGLALYWTHSRAAYVGAIVALVVLWLASRRFSRAVKAGAAVAGVVLIVLVLLISGSRVQVSSGRSLDMRWDMAKIALQITAQHPVFGVGLAGFRQASRAFVTPELRERFPATVAGENAHNNFLQILAELGIAGLGAFLWLIAVAARAWMETRRSESGAGAIAAQHALTGGLLALLVSCLAGHPFLMPEVLWAFCLVLGAAVGLASERDGVAPARWAGRLAWTLFFVVLASAPVRLWQLQHAERDQRFIGAGGLTSEDSDRPYRRVGVRSVWFVPGQTRIAVLPLRMTAASPASCVVRVNLDGRQINSVAVTPREWLPLTVELDTAEAASASRRLELWVDDEACQGMVGEPAFRE